MTELPDPLTPADCDLRGMPFMPLQVNQLLDSDLFIKSSGDEFKAAVALWCKSWNQIPGGSLPDDDQILEELSRSKQWKKVKTMALRGWFKCSDGRLYHEVVAQNAIKAWESREEHRETNESRNERQRRWREKVKELSTRLRDAGITPPMNVSLAELEHLVAIHVDKSVDTKTSTPTSTVDNSETANKGQSKRERKNTSPDLLSESEQLSDFLIPLVDGTDFQVPVRLETEWKAAYPAVDVPQELREMRTWALANKAKRKTRNGIERFIVAWLGKAQDTPSRAIGQRPAGSDWTGSAT